MQTIVNDDKIKQYFLGELDQAESNSFEELIASDAELSENAHVVESEMIDAYLKGSLAQTERNLFETNYLTTATRKQKVRLAQIFLATIKTPSQNILEVSPKIPLLQSIFGQFQLSRVFAVAAVLILLGGAFAFFVLNRRNQNEIAVQNDSNLIAPPENQPDTNIPATSNQVQNTNVNTPVVNSNSNTNRPEKSPTPSNVVKTTGPTFASFSLLPGTLRSGGEQFIKISPNTLKINLALSLPKDLAKYQTYTATIKTADGTTVFVAPKLNSPTVSLPANKLTNTTTYIIFLKGNSPNKPAESIAEYTFAVRR